MRPSPPTRTMQLSQLLDGLAPLAAGDDCVIRALQTDSRKVQPGDVFIARAGPQHDGRDYIAQAIARQAAAVLYQIPLPAHFALPPAPTVKIPLIGMTHLSARSGLLAARYFDYPSRAITVIGVTGTNGKTTTAYLLAQAFGGLGRRCAYAGTIGVGWPEGLQPAALTTVDAIAMQQQLADFRAAKARAACLEISSHGLDQDRAHGVDFTGAVFTNLSRDHLDYHGSMARYAAAKKKLFAVHSLHYAVVNAEDATGRAIARDWIDPARDCLTYGVARGHLQTRDRVIDARGIAFTATFDGRTARMTSPLLGAVNVPNLLAVIGVLLCEDYSLTKIAEILPRLNAPPGRLEIFRQNGRAVVVDYAHSPDALCRALSSLKPLCRGKLIVVFGCGGERDRAKRPQMGKIAATLADRVILTDDNPRGEPPDAITTQIQQGINQPVTIIHARAEALHVALADSERNDMILLAGKGHEQTQTIGDVVRPLNDRELAVTALAART